MEDHIIEFFDLDEFGFDCESVIIDTILDHNNILYPNPNNGKFSYFLSDHSGGKCNVKILNLNGVVVYAKELSIEGNTIYFDFEYLTSGIYILHLNTDTFSLSSRFVIIK